MNQQEEEELLQQRQLKQNYLKQEIIEKGYDGAEFAEFLNCIKAEGGSNVDMWSFKEVTDLVDRFKNVAMQRPAVEENPPLEPSHNTHETLSTSESQQYFKPINMNESNSSRSKEAKEIKIITTKETKDAKNSARQKEQQGAGSPILVNEENKVENDSYHAEEEEEMRRSRDSLSEIHADVVPREREETYQGVLNVKLGEVTQLNDMKNIEIFVHGFEHFKSGLFSGTHTQYLIKTLPCGWDVKRRYSDFFWLRSTLQKLHPGHMIPPIPKKNNKSKYKPDFLKKRMYFLQRFLNACVLNEELRADKYFYAFISMNDENNFKNQKKEADKKQRYSRVKDIQTVTGQVPVQINRELKYHAASMGELCNQTDPLYTKIKKLSKQLVTEIEQVSNTIFNLGECYAGLYGAASNFNKHTESGKNLHLEDIYLTLNNMMVAWAEQTLSQTENIQKHFSSFYKYADYENEAFKEVLESRTKTGLEYVAKRKEIITKKEKLFQQKDLSKWEVPVQKQRDINKETIFKDKRLAFDLMLPKDTAILNDMKTTFGYYNAMCFNELDKALREKCRQYAKNFYEFGKAQSNIMIQVETKWNDLLGHFTDGSVSGGSRGGEIKRRATVLKNKSDDMNKTEGNYYDD